MDKKKIIITTIVSLLIIVPIIVFAIFRMTGAQASPTILVVRESGAVFLKTSEEAEYSEMTDDEMIITTGTFIKTSEKAYARVFMPDNSLISIDEKTEIQINYEEDKININQLIGKTWNRVQSVSQGGEYTIKTPNTIAAVRGTVFVVEVENDNISRVYVQEGKVEVSRYEEENGEDKILETIELNPDEMSETIKDGDFFGFERSEITDFIKDLFWFRRNIIIDGFYFDLLNKNVDLRGSLTISLQNYDSRSEFLFDEKAGSDEITEEELKEKLASVIDITQINEQTCDNHTSQDFFNARDQLNAYSEYVEQYGVLNDFLLTLENVCSDSDLTGLEIEQLQSQISNFN